MSLVLTRNSYLRNHLPRLRHIDPESSPHWEKYYLPKTLRSPKLYGWYHNNPYAQWNNYSHFALNARTLTHTVAQQIFKAPHLSRFSEILRLAESSVLAEISSQGPFTIFAPTNEALLSFAGKNLPKSSTAIGTRLSESNSKKRKIPSASSASKGRQNRPRDNLNDWDKFVADLKGNPIKLQNFLRRHICKGNRKIRAVRSGGEVLTLEGNKLNFKLKTVDAMGGVGGKVPTLKYSVGGVEIGDYDFRCSNGLVHFLGGVLEK